jgi:hypothetical protein
MLKAVHKLGMRETFHAGYRASIEEPRCDTSGGKAECSPSRLGSTPATSAPGGTGDSDPCASVLEKKNKPTNPSQIRKEEIKQTTLILRHE